MIKNKTIKASTNFHTVLFGGSAGDGAKEAAINFGRLVAKYGYDFFISVEYPSLIRGGHNYARITFGAGEIKIDENKLDALVAVNNETVLLHKKELKSKGLIFADVQTEEKPIVIIPALDWAKENKLPAITRISAFLGALVYYFNFDLKKLNEIFLDKFGSMAEPNIELAKKGYDLAKSKKIQQIILPKAKIINKKILEGNEALAEGFVAGGLKNYFAYPMTPSSSILHHLSRIAKEKKLKVVQPENELAVINMALGSAYGGARTAVASSCGGFALMLEAMAMAGMAEIPIVVADSQRAGTSTGIPTRTGQGDLGFVRNMPGEYPRIVIAPGDHEECFDYGALAMNLAWQFQTPTVVLLDKQISESVASIDLSNKKINIIGVKKPKNGFAYQRYAFCADGISPLVHPGEKGAVVKISSYEHDENGYITDEPQMVKKMYDKRFAKLNGIKKEMKKHKTIKVFGDKKSKNVVVFFGSVKGAVLTAIKQTKKSFKAIQIIWLEPFDENLFIKETKNAKKIICVENNFTGQLGKLIREKTGIKADSIRQYNSMPFSADDLSIKLNKLC
jgi:2-oxoglutarate ferredoxin oxidoreductase subunit alpha